MSTFRQLLRKANECQQLKFALRQFHLSSLKKTCEASKCIKRDRQIKEFLHRTESNYLQPMKKQIVPSIFKEQKPIVPPVINMILEKHCRIIEECKKGKNGRK